MGSLQQQVDTTGENMQPVHNISRNAAIKSVAILRIPLDDECRFVRMISSSSSL